MTRAYYREAVGALVVFDVTRASTFDAVLKWKDDLDSKVSQTETFSFSLPAVNPFEFDVSLRSSRAGPEQFSSYDGGGGGQ